MPKLSSRILSNKKRKDGQLEILIALAHNGRTRYIKTGIWINSEKEFDNGIVVKRNDATVLNLNVQRLISNLSDRIKAISYVDGLTCEELIQILNTTDTPDIPTISKVFDEFIEVSPMKPSSKTLSLYLIKGIKQFFGENYNLQNLSLLEIMKYDMSLRRVGNKPATIASKVSLLSKLYTYARRIGYVKSELSPFTGYRPPEVSARESWLSRDEIIRLRDVVLTDKMASTIRDYIMLSYYLGGINIIDLLKIDFKKCKRTNVLKYVRTKTEHQRKVNKYVEFGIPDEAWQILNRILETDGHLGSSYQRKSNMHYYFAQGITALRCATGLPQLVYYSARKSFAQHAFQLGISTAIIDYILGHKLDRGGNTLYSYISVTPEMATKAIRVVLDNLK